MNIQSNSFAQMRKPCSYPVSGLVFDRHQRDSRTSEPGEAVSCLQGLPVLLSGDGRGEARFRQRATAGRTTKAFHAGRVQTYRSQISGT